MGYRSNLYYYETMMFLFGILSAVYSYAMGVAADSWLALMDRLLILGDECIEERDLLKANIIQLIDIYYDALDAPKKGGRKVSSVFFSHYLPDTRASEASYVSVLTLPQCQYFAYNFRLIILSLPIFISPAFLG